MSAMALEIERKFLVEPSKLPPLEGGAAMRQGYLSLRPTVRIRLAVEAGERSARLTVKGPGRISREEFEYEVPTEDGEAMFALCESRLEKTRFRLGRWEVDRFEGTLAGLWLAECELSSEDEPLPEGGPWLGREVTGDSSFSNARLAARAVAPRSAE